MAGEGENRMGPEGAAEMRSSRSQEPGGVGEIRAPTPSRGEWARRSTARVGFPVWATGCGWRGLRKGEAQWSGGSRPVEPARAGVDSGAEAAGLHACVCVSGWGGSGQQRPGVGMGGNKRGFCLLLGASGRVEV